MIYTPLILTLRLDRASFNRLDALRREHFPADWNFLHAHLTLFHALPGLMEAEVAANLATLAAGTAPIPLDFDGLRGLGRGVAISVESPALIQLRGMLASAWHGMLGVQDRQGFRPHVTVQNKVDPTTARALQAELKESFTPWQGVGDGLSLWRYRGGPWEPAGEFVFKA